MEVIPVIDLKDGEAVHARQGLRNSYAPIRSRLCDGSAPRDLLRGYLELFAFKTLYLADLDAITAGAPPALDVVRALQAAAPGLDLWVDAGFSDIASCRRLLDETAATLVLGSESQSDTRLLAALSRQADRVVLSLDFKDDRFLGPEPLLAARETWPARIIVMALSRVGSGQGPDTARLAALRAADPDHRYYAAGGVRHAEDLASLRRERVDGALIASVLHDGRVTREDLHRVASA